MGPRKDMDEQEPEKRLRGRPRKRDVAKVAAMKVLDGTYITATEAAVAYIGQHYGTHGYTPYVEEGSTERHSVYWQFRAKIIEEMRAELSVTPRDGRLGNGHIWRELSQNTRKRGEREKGKRAQFEAFIRELDEALARIAPVPDEAER